MQVPCSARQSRHAKSYVTSDACVHQAGLQDTGTLSRRQGDTRDPARLIPAHSNDRDGGITLHGHANLNIRVAGQAGALEDKVRRVKIDRAPDD